MKLLALLTSILVGRSLTEPGQCEEISIPMCKEIGYNFTRLPNQFNHESQDEVSSEHSKEWLSISGLDGLINKENEKNTQRCSELSRNTEISAFFCLQNIERNNEN